MSSRVRCRVSQTVPSFIAYGVYSDTRKSDTAFDKHRAEKLGFDATTVLWTGVRSPLLVYSALTAERTTAASSPAMTVTPRNADKQLWGT